ncbi:MAG: autorepressor SdpR family transcription factor [Chitinophagaceae bacterium]
MSKYMQPLTLAFKALNDETRRQILELLRPEDLSAGEIAAHFDMTAPSISHHLDLLKRAGMVDARKQGQQIIYSLNTTVVDEIISWLFKLNNKKIIP